LSGKCAPPSYEHIEYTPYGELWVERTASDLAKTPFRFTGKELDEETGLYYYGARYLNPQTGMWLSADPAMGEYIPRAPIDDEARKYNQNLPGMGGVFNYVNLHTYHYAGNNPVKLTDPDGREEKLGLGEFAGTVGDVGELAFDALSAMGEGPTEISQSDLMETVSRMNGIFDAIGEKPVQYGVYASVLGVLGSIGYDIYKKDEKVRGFVNSAVKWVGETNDRLMSRGIDLWKQTLTLATDKNFTGATQVGGAMGGGSVSMTTDNAFTFRFNPLTTLSVQLGLGVNVPLNSSGPNGWNVTPANLGFKLHFSTRF
jgi:RHS repeat-associated protein